MLGKPVEVGVGMEKSIFTEQAMLPPMFVQDTALAGQKNEGYLHPTCSTCVAPSTVTLLLEGSPPNTVSPFDAEAR